MNEEQTIRGETLMNWEDQLRCSVRPGLRAMAIFSIALMGVFLIVWALYLSAGQWLLLQRTPAAALGLFVHDVWRIYLTCMVAMLALIIGLYTWAFHRLPTPNRQLAYEATRDGLVTRDGANLALTVPWSSVTGVRNDDYMMHVRLATGVWRTIFWRAFAAGDRAQILEWARKAGKS